MVNDQNDITVYFSFIMKLFAIAAGDLARQQGDKKDRHSQRRVWLASEGLCESDDD